VKGKALYTNFLNQEDHEKIYSEIKQINTPWLITYDNVNEISDIYQDYTQYEFSLSYTVNPKACRRATELLIASDVDKLESISKEIFKKIDLKKKEIIYA
jgi:DNA adenine methylase